MFKIVDTTDPGLVRNTAKKQQHSFGVHMVALSEIAILIRKP